MKLKKGTEMNDSQEQIKKNGELNDHYQRECTPSEHIYCLAHPITGNNTTQDYVCINCNKVKKGIRN